jgi:hypothetical protein
MKRLHWDVGESKIACMSMPAPANYERTTNAADVTCQCCLPFSTGRYKVGDFTFNTLRKKARRASLAEQSPDPTGAAHE